MGDYVFCGYLATKPKIRNVGFGTEIVQRYLQIHRRNIILEVAPPETNSVDSKMVKFYRRIGFTLDKHYYFQLSLGSGKKQVKLYLMTFPSEFSDEEFDKMRKMTYGIVYDIKT